MDQTKTPFPYYGGKRDAAPLIWDRLGDVGHYVEPFMGSLAVLLLRPHLCNRPYFSESVNDIDGLLVNAYRAMHFYPDETAEYASWPVSELDLTARHLWLVRWHDEANKERLAGDVEWCDPKAAGYWIWGVSCWIGSGWCDGTGPWTVGADGRIRKQARGLREPGVSSQLPHLSSNGRGVNRPQAREPGVGDYHPMTMPEIRRWFGFLSARLRHVRIICGDWSRLVTRAASITLSCDKKNPCGVFLDPPYAVKERTSGLYTHDDDGNLPVAVREWCKRHGDDPLYRIALAGFEGEGHEELESLGWTCEEWYKSGFIKGGYGNQNSENGNQQHRERLWFSPHCLRPETSDSLEQAFAMFE